MLNGPITSGFNPRIDDKLCEFPQTSQTDPRMSISEDYSPIDNPHYNIKRKEALIRVICHVEM